MSCCCACDEGEALEPLLPRRQWCPKCASSDLYMRWMLNENECSYTRRYGVFRPCADAKGEHVEVHCRGCGFGWNEEPLDSLPVGFEG